MSTTPQKTYPINSNWNPVPGVYAIMNGQMQVIYIGKTDNLKRRMSEHQQDATHAMHNYKPAFVHAEVLNDELTRSIRERQLIAQHNPPCNRHL